MATPYEKHMSQASYGRVRTTKDEPALRIAKHRTTAEPADYRRVLLN
jgi:hypothetical protein